MGIEMLRSDGGLALPAVQRNSGVQSTYPIHTHDFYEFFLVTGGQALHVVNSTTHLIRRGTLVLIRPWDVHFYDSYRKGDLVFYNSGFPRGAFEQADRLFCGALGALAQSPFPKHVCLDEGMIDQMERRLNELVDDGERDTSSPRYRLVLAMVCGLMLEHEHMEPRDRMPDWLFELMRQMELRENFVEGLPRLLSLANYSQEYVNRVFRRYLNTTPTRFINEKRLALARELLHGRSADVAGVSEQCGFHNLSNFYEQYKARFHCPPGRDRRGGG